MVRRLIGVMLGLVLLCAGLAQAQQNQFTPSALAPKVINWTVSAGTNPLPFVQLIGGQNICTVDVSGTWSGTLDSQGSNGWWPVDLAPFNAPASLVSSITANGLYVFISAGLTQWRVSPEAGMTGTATVGGSCVWTPLASGGGTGSFTGVLYPPVTSYGAICNGVFDNKSIINGLVNGTTLPASVPYGPGCYVSEGFNALPMGRFVGPGNLITLDSATPNPRARYTSTISTPVPYTGPETSYGSAFNGDCSLVQICWGTNITGTATLGEPTSGFTINPMTSGVYGFVRNTSGWNNSLSSDSGRTATVAYHTDIYNTGNGGVQAYNCEGTLGGALSGATSFLANPSAECFGGQIVAIANGVYLNPYEIVISDQGHDAAGIGIVDRLNRTNATGALGAVWQGINFQSEGSAPIDTAVSATGPMTMGMDFSAINGGASTVGTAVFAFAANNCIYPNATNPGGPNAVHFARYTVPGNDMLCYSSADSAMEITDGGNLTIQSKSTGVLLPSAKNKGQVSCTPSSSTTCSSAPTVTVLSGAVCTASYDSTTAATASTLLPLFVGVVGTTLTITPRTTTSQSALLVADYLCA